MEEALKQDTPWRLQ